MESCHQNRRGPSSPVASPEDNRLDIIATDHAPHLPGEKAGVYTQSASGGPMVQHSLIVMLELMEKGQITLENIVDKMCHAPADIFHVEERGYLREGYKQTSPSSKNTHGL